MVLVIPDRWPRLLSLLAPENLAASGEAVHVTLTLQPHPNTWPPEIAAVAVECDPKLSTAEVHVTTGPLLPV